MRSGRLLVLGVASVAVGAGAWLLARREPRSVPSPPSATRAIEPSRPPISGDPSTRPARGRALDELRARLAAAPPASGPAGSAVRLRREQILVEVNGVPVRARDLAAPRGDGELSMTPEMFDSLRARAVQRELFAQEARRRGIELSGRERQQLAELRAARASRTAGPPGAGPTTDEIDFEVRDAEGLMLRNALLEKAGISPHVTSDDVEAYYRAHASGFPPLPEDAAARAAAWAKIELAIRNRIAPDKQRAYLEAIDELVTRLQASAVIELPPS